MHLYVRDSKLSGVNGNEFSASWMAVERWYIWDSVVWDIAVMLTGT